MEFGTNNYLEKGKHTPKLGHIILFFCNCGLTPPPPLSFGHSLSLSASYLLQLLLRISLSVILFQFQSSPYTPTNSVFLVILLNSMDYSSSSSSSSSSSPKPNHHSNNSTTDTITDADTTSSSSSSSSAVHRALHLVQYDDLDSKLQGAREIRRLTKTSQRCRRLLSDSVQPLVSMLRLHDSPESNESALLALLNLAVKDETYAALSLSVFLFLVYFYLLLFLTKKNWICCSEWKFCRILDGFFFLGICELRCFRNSWMIFVEFRIYSTDFINDYYFFFFFGEKKIFSLSFFFLNDFALAYDKKCGKEIENSAFEDLQL